MKKRMDWKQVEKNMRILMRGNPPDLRKPAIIMNIMEARRYFSEEVIQEALSRNDKLLLTQGYMDVYISTAVFATESKP